jgi:transcriptional regulator with GAF, ATPase, and Fis domain
MPGAIGMRTALVDGQVDILTVCDHRNGAALHAACFGGVGSAMSVLNGAGNARADVSALSGGGTTMLFTNLAWVLLLMALAFAGWFLGQHTDANTNRLRTGGPLFVLLGVAGLLTAGAFAPDLLRVTALPFALTILTGTALFAVALTRIRRGEASIDTDDAMRSLWIAASRAVVDSPSLDAMLMAAGSAMRRATQSRAAVVFKLARNGHDTVLVGAACRDFVSKDTIRDHQHLDSLARRSIADPRVAVYRRGGADPSAAHADSWGLVPLQCNATVYGAVLLQQPTVSIMDAANARALTGVGQLIGRAVADWVNTTISATAQRLIGRLPRLLAELTAEKTFERSLPSVARALDGLVEADFLSISWLDRTRYHEDRASMVVGDQKILDQRRKWPIWQGTTHKILDMPRPLVTPDLSALSNEDEGDVPSLEQRLGYRSRIVVPIRIAGSNGKGEERLIGALTLAHNQVARYGEDEARPLRLIASILGSWLSKLEAQRANEEAAAAMDMVAELEQETVRYRSEEELLRDVLPAVGTTGLRVYRLTEDGEHLESVASAGWRDTDTPEGDAPKQRLPLADMPWHRWVLAESQPRCVDQSDPESLMGTDEVRSAMIPGLKTAWIIPIRVNGRTMGVLDAMEARHPDRQVTGPYQRSILMTAARMIASHWSEAADERSARTTNAACRRQLKALNGTIVNPITGIIGSVELIRHKQSGLTPESVKYLNLIEHSATRIHEALLGTLDDIQDDGSEHPLEESETMARRLFGALTLPAVSERLAAAERMRVPLTTVPVGAQTSSADKT